MRIGSTLSGMDLTALNNLSRSSILLQQSNQRLSTMKRINRGADDPAGLIALEQMQSELESIRAANDNAARAAGAIHVADSAMGEASKLLNTIRGHLVAAVGGSLSDAEIGAKQIEVDAALEALNRLGGYTSFGGRKLLDGSAGFEVSNVDSSQVTSIDVYQNAGGGTQTVDVEVLQAATSATLSYDPAAGSLDADVTLAVSSGAGTTTLQFSAGASIDDVATAVNATSGDSGVTAAVQDGQLVFSSVAVGSEAFVDVEAVAGSFDVDEGRASGSDVVARVDGVEITGDGDKLHVNTESLQADMEFASGFSGQVDPITVSGSAMTFVFSPNVSQTSTLALPSLNPVNLGGSAGRLSELASGGSFSLANGNFSAAMDVLDTASSQILDARVRAGSFEKYTIESSMRILDSMEENISAAKSRIGDTDVAAETSRLIRAQILFSAGLSTLATTSKQRGAVLGLLGMTM